jgi:hypothetical protein
MVAGRPTAYLDLVAVARAPAGCGAGFRVRDRLPVTRPARSALTEPIPLRQFLRVTEGLHTHTILRMRKRHIRMDQASPVDALIDRIEALFGGRAFNQCAVKRTGVLSL